MIRIFLAATVLVVALITPEALAMGALTKKDLADAQGSARIELKNINDAFQIGVTDRLAQVETLPGLEITEPWILRASSSDNSDFQAASGL